MSSDENTDPDASEASAPPTVVLVVDPDAEDRALFRQLVEAGDRDLTVVRADSIAAAAGVCADLDALALFIIAVDPDSPDEAFDFRDLLTETELSIHEIAARTGFEYGEYMAAAFKRETGMTPTEFRDR